MNKVIIYQSKFLGNKKQVDFKKKELYFTEKFALLNLLNMLGKLSQPQNAPPAADGEPQQPPPAQTYEEPAKNNMFASVLARHEEISNRIKNKK